MYAPVSPDEHARRMTLYAQGLNDYEMAEVLGIKWNATRFWRHGCKLPAVTHCAPRKLTLEQEKRRMDMYKQGMTDREIAEAEDVPRKTIYHWRRYRNIAFNPGNWGGIPMHEALPPEGCQLVKTFLHTLVTLAGRESKVPDVGAFIHEWRKQKYGISRGKWVGMRTMRV